MKIEIDKNGCNFVDIDCNESFPLNIAFNCNKEIKKYLGSRIKNIEEIGGGINEEEVIYKIMAREGTISIYADWAGVDVRAENIDSNTLIYELYNHINKKFN